MNKRVLVVGASVLQLPMIQTAKRLGYYVGVADYNPKAVGVPLADRFFCVSTIDKEKIYESALEMKADGIATCATDMPMRSVAYAASRLNLRAITEETALKATDKAEMIRAFHACGVACPWFYVVDSRAELEKISPDLTYPCILKPTDNSGSRGVVKVESEQELFEAFDYSSGNGRSGRVIVEEYLSGSEVSVETFTLNGKTEILAITDKITTGAPYFVELGHTQPSALPAHAREDIADLARRAVAAVGIDNGAGHVEIMYTANGARMIELGARMGGDFITAELVPLSTGIDMLRATIECACGETPDLQPKHQMGSAIRYFRTGSGTIRAFKGLNEARAVPGVVRVETFKEVGEAVGDIHSSTDRVGCVIAQGRDHADAAAICEAALSKIEVELI